MRSQRTGQRLYDKQRDHEVAIARLEMRGQKRAAKAKAIELREIYTSRENYLLDELADHPWLLWLHIMPSIWSLRHRRTRLIRRFKLE